MPLRGRSKRPSREMLRIAVTPEEKSQIVDRAETSGTSISNLIREKLDLPLSTYGENAPSLFEPNLRFNSKVFSKQIDMVRTDHGSAAVEILEYTEFRILLEEIGHLEELPGLMAGIMDENMYGKNTIFAYSPYGRDPNRFYTEKKLRPLLDLIAQERELNLPLMLTNMNRLQILELLEFPELWSKGVNGGKWYADYVRLKYLETEKVFDKYDIERPKFTSRPTM